VSEPAQHGLIRFRTHEFRNHICVQQDHARRRGQSRRGASGMGSRAGRSSSTPPRAAKRP
jgi:hypothetical protein